MRAFWPLGIAVASLALAGCGDEPSSTDALGGSKAPATSAAGFTATVTGVVSETVSAKARVFCGMSPTMQYDQKRKTLDVTAFAKANQFSLKFPHDIGVGTHPISWNGKHGSIVTGAIGMYYQDSNRTRYSRDGKGELVLQQLPNKEGDLFKGRVNASLTDRSGNTIQLNAVLDFKAGPQSFDECP